jgi:hypothetical protein
MKKLLFTLLFLTLGTAWGDAFEDGLATSEVWKVVCKYKY